MIFTPNGFLKIGGVILLLLGLLGYVLPGGQILGDTWYLTPGENIAHLVLGVVALIAAYVLPMGAQRSLVWLVGLLALLFAVWGYMVADVPPLNWYGLANLENPLDNILHLVVGVWAVWAASRKSSSMMM